LHDNPAERRPVAILNVSEIWNGRVGSIDDKFRRQYNRVFRVVTDSAHIGPLPVYLASGIPVIGDAYVDQAAYFDTGVVCKKVEARQTDDPFTWNVVATFDAEVHDPEKQSSPSKPSPLDRLPEISWSFDHFQAVAKIDIVTKNPVRNSAEDPFDPPPEIDDSWPKLTIQRNELIFDPQVAFAYRNAVNSDPWMGGAPKTWKVFGISASSKYENGLQFWSVSYEFHYKSLILVTGGVNTEYGWSLVLLDIGGQEIDVATNSIKTITDPHGVPIQRPLDGAGHKAAFGAAPYYITFTVYPSLSFAALNLP
jgi:hypothetical protein